MLIRGGRVVDVDGDRVSDLRVGADGRVAELGTDLEPHTREEVVDATGRLVVPGGVDAHTHMHLRVGEVEVADGVASASVAAALGGTTSVLEYVSPVPGQTAADALAEWRCLSHVASIDVGFHLTVVEPIAEAEIDAAMEAGVTSFKVCMSGRDDRSVDDGVVLDVLRSVGSRGGVVVVHAENGGAIGSLEREALRRGRRAPIEQALARPAVLEGETTARAAMLAEMVDVPLYLPHISSAPALEAVRRAQERGVRMTVETCPQYLYLSADRMGGDDGDTFVCSPPLREGWHAEELWYGLAAGWIHTVASDHAAWSTADIRAGAWQRPEGRRDFTEIPEGLPGVETRMALMWAGVVDGRLRASDWVRLCAEAPAKAFGLWPAKGSLQVGADADVVLWDPLREHKLDVEDLHMDVDHSPYRGMTLHGWPETVLLRGEPVVDRGSFVGSPGAGRYLSRSPVPAA
ncbi:dihydropyrimidinase [Dermatobacter hominis]|uniref:dihydropyrimidinase n=1 Tax=Dermatobacter hominis TaxID=2884263 RepID=UPI001D0FE75B|nr:dihydropyrimidinase [Dermatobacter hominis]UDY35490.1 dihydropyrimidinase [Dermatobacter hominis]